MLGLHLGMTLGNPTLNAGVGVIVINGVRYARLVGANGQYLTGAAGTPLYGRVA